MKKVLCLLLVVCFCFVSCTGDKFDVSRKMQNLGINGSEYWSDDTQEDIDSRVPFDMISTNGEIYLTGGSYIGNTGPVYLYAYKNDSKKGEMVGGTDAEQINAFYEYDGVAFSFSVEPRLWDATSVYYKTAESDMWGTKTAAIDGANNCFDMIKYKDKFFFAGSDSEKIEYEGGKIATSKATLYCLEKDILTAEKADYTQLEVVSQNGEIITFESIIQKHPTSGSYIAYGLPRMYSLFVYKDNLYAFYFNQGSNDYTGFYRYDEEKNQFVYDEETDATFLINECRKTAQDDEKIVHKFEWKDKFYFITNNLIVTDLKTYSFVKVAGYEDYKVQDVIFREDYALCLVTRENEDGKFKNAVLKTTDFENFETLFYFTSKLGAQSFEESENMFYFGLGYDTAYELDENGNIAYDPVTYQPTQILPKNYKEAGRVLRYRLKQ